jgi:hypothetical protein
VSYSKPLQIMGIVLGYVPIEVEAFTAVSI